MSFVIQLFRLSNPESNVGHWSTTNWSKDNQQDAEKLLDDIVQNFRVDKSVSKARIIKIIKELPVVPKTH